MAETNPFGDPDLGPTLPANAQRAITIHFPNAKGGGSTEGTVDVNTVESAPLQAGVPMGPKAGAQSEKITKEDVQNFFEAKGLPSHVAAGIARRVGDESGFDTGIVNKDSGAVGLFQDLGSRKSELQAQPNWRSSQTQLENAWRELTGGDPQATAHFGEMISAPDEATAYKLFTHHFERPGAQGGDVMAGGKATDINGKSSFSWLNPIGTAEAKEPQPGQFQSYKDLVAATPSDYFNYTATKQDGMWQWTPNKALPSQQNLTQGPQQYNQTMGDEQAEFIREFERQQHRSVGQDMQDLGESLGKSGLNTLSHVLGAPADLINFAQRFIAPDFNMGKPLYQQSTAQGIYDTLTGKLGINPQIKESTPSSYLGSKIGEYGSVSALSYVMGMLALSRAGTSLGGMIGNAIKQFNSNPLKATMRETEYGAMTGSAAAAGGEVARSMEGKEITPGKQAVGEMAGMLSPLGVVRGPAMVKAMRSGNPIVRKTIRTGKTLVNAIRGKLDTLPPTMSNEQAREAVKNVLQDNVVAALDNAKAEMQALGMGTILPNGQVDPILFAKAKEHYAEIIRSNLRDVLGKANDLEKLLWGAVKSDDLRNFEGSRDMFKTMMATAQRDATIQGTGDFPLELARAFLNEQKGLGNIDLVHNGVLLRNRILDQIQAGSATPGLTEKLQNLEQQLLRDLSAPVMQRQARIGGQSIPVSTGETTGAVDDNFLNAVAFSKLKNEVFGNSGFASLIQGNKYGQDTVTGAEALGQMLTQGPRGAAALDAIAQAAQAKFGGTAPTALVAATKDALRLQFMHDVAPQGFVNPVAAQRFMDKHAPVISRWPDVEAQFKNAIQSENQAISMLGTYERQPIWQQRERAAALYLDSPPEQAMSYVMRSQNQYAAQQAVVKQLAEDPTGKALTGWKQMLGKDFLDAGLGKQAEWMKDNAGAIRAINEVDPGFAERLKEVSTMTSPTGQMNFLLELFARKTGAALGNKLAGEGMGQSLLMSSFGSRKMVEWIKGLPAVDSTNFTAAMLADPEVYKAFNTLAKGALAGAKPSLDAFNFMHGFIPAMGLPALDMQAQGQLMNPSTIDQGPDSVLGGKQNPKQKGP